MPYRVIDADTGSFVRSLITELAYEFETGDQAQRFSKALAEDTGRKYRVKKVLNTEWRKREQRKFDEGDYDYLPWYSDDWWNDPSARVIHQYQFPHPSRKQPGMIAYIESEEKGMDNIVTRIKPGKYLEQFRSILKVYGRDLQKTAARFTVIYEPRKLLIAETEDDIQWVYENGPPSCMSTKAYRAEHSWGYGGRGKWPLDIHACRMYAGPDLKVAYIVADEENPRKTRGVLGRAVIWPERKTHSRVYGEELAMNKCLEQHGYSFNPPIGARIQRVVVDKIHYVCPYLDGGAGSGQGALGVLDKGDHLEIVPFRTPMSHCANSTSGATGHACGPDGREAQPRACQHCGQGPLIDVVQVFTSGTDYLFWCGTCRTDRAVQCGYDSRWYDTNYMEFVEMYNGQRWSQRAFNSRGFTCQATQKKYPREMMIKLEDGTLWSTDYASKHGERCGYSGFWSRKEDMVTVYDRNHRPMRFSKSVANLYCFDCAVCHDLQWDGKTFPGGKRPEGPMICYTCKSKDSPQGKASVEALQQTPAQERENAMNSFCFYHGEIVRASDYVATVGEMPDRLYNRSDLSYACSQRQYENFLRHGPMSMVSVAGAPVLAPPPQAVAPGQIWSTGGAIASYAQASYAQQMREQQAAIQSALYQTARQLPTTRVPLEEVEIELPED